MDRFKDMQLVVAVVEKGNFARAAKALGITPAMVGRRIATMESELGFMLFNRSTRSMELTPGGQTWYEGCLRILAEINELQESVTSAHRTNPKGQIRLSAPDGLGSPFLIDAIGQFRQSYPEVSFDIDISSQPLDLIREKIDLSIRLAFQLDDSSMVATPLGKTGFGLYAAPAYLAANPAPRTLNKLKQHDLLHMGSSRYGEAWSILVDGSVISFRQPWTLTVPNTECLIDATQKGMGIAMIPELFARPLEYSGKLARLEGVAEFPELTIYAIYPTRKHLPYRVNLFLDFLKQWAPAQLRESFNGVSD